MKCMRLKDSKVTERVFHPTITNLLNNIFIFLTKTALATSEKKHNLTSSLLVFGLAFWLLPFAQSHLDEMMAQAEYIELYLNKGIHINI